jgi:hypothetical protein
MPCPFAQPRSSAFLRVPRGYCWKDARRLALTNAGRSQAFQQPAEAFEGQLLHRSRSHPDEPGVVVDDASDRTPGPKLMWASFPAIACWSQATAGPRESIAKVGEASR